MGNLEHAQELNEEGSQSAGYNCLLWSWAISQQQATCMNTTEWLQEAVTRVQKTNQSAIFTSRLYCCSVTFLWSDFKVYFEFKRAFATESRGIQCRTFWKASFLTYVRGPNVFWNKWKVGLYKSCILFISTFISIGRLNSTFRLIINRQQCNNDSSWGLSGSNCNLPCHKPYPPKLLLLLLDM